MKNLSDKVYGSRDLSKRPVSGTSDPDQKRKLDVASSLGQQEESCSSVRDSVQV